MKFYEKEEIIKRIKFEMKLKKITQPKLAEELGKSSNYINMMLNGKRELSDEILGRFGLVRLEVYSKVKEGDINDE